MELTERLLNDAGGWQTMKQARGLLEMGRVAGATWEPPLLRGSVREGDREFRAGLKIVSRTNVENLCTCRASREHGAICAHSVAVGLEWLKPKATGGAKAVEVAKGVADGKGAAGGGGAGAGATGAKGGPAGAALQKLPAFSTDEGEPVQVQVILPPNFPSAWSKGSLVVGLEAVWAGKRVMLSALPKSTGFRANEGDLRLVARVRELADGETPGMLALNREQFLEILGALPGHPGVTFGKSSAAAVNGQGVLPELRLEPLEGGRTRVRAVLPEGATALIAGVKAWLLKDGSFCPLASGLPAGYLPILEAEQTLTAAQAESFVERELPALRPYFRIDESLIPQTQKAARKTQTAGFALELEGSLTYLTAKLTAIYGDQRVTISSAPGRFTEQRDRAAETEAIDRLRRAGFEGPDAAGQLVLKGEQRILAFFARDLPWWERTAAVTIGSRFEYVTRHIERVQPRLEVRSSGENWFELQIELASGSGERFAASEIQRLLQSGQSHVRRKNGTVAVFDAALLDDFQQVLKDCEPNQRQPGLYQIDRRHAGYLEGMATEKGLELTAPPKWSKSIVGKEEVSALEAIPLGSLEAVLRVYQKHGVNWMNHLARNGFCGILADEMGLGKTVQTLAFLRHLGGKALIVCPSSLVYNWEREAAHFTPGRKVLAMAGAKRRELFGEPLAGADLVVTSYALLRRDAELYRGKEFQALVLDEAQHIKNPESQNAQAAISVRAKHRFALTGTPVENSVRDIWSLMNFLMPGYLGSRDDFRDRYEVPIGNAPGGPEHGRLVKRLRPFVLRRKKQDVLTELPDKIEQVSYCELGAQQRELYTALLGSARREASELAGSKNHGRARIQILTALLRLRQACCDVRLLQPEADGETEALSGKLGAFDELLLEAVDGGHRVLLFSQFVSMLGILRRFLDEQAIDYCYLDGSTKDRAGQVDKFQKGETPVFLISLKAGGVGLNLTAADTVIHFDPWWNPAVEAQATDRAHRIGQKKVVTSYKLIARNTIEEKILGLQQKKRQVIDATIESEEPLMQGLSMDDLQELLE